MNRLLALLAILLAVAFLRRRPRANSGHWRSLRPPDNANPTRATVVLYGGWNDEPGGGW